MSNCGKRIWGGSGRKMEQFIHKMPKVELHVHLEGSIRPETLLKLANRHHIALPASDIAGIRAWYNFRDFSHFIEIYIAIAKCLRSVDDIELITRDFLQGQADQNIQYSEVTYSASTQYIHSQLGFHEQIDAINRARVWGEKELGVKMGVIVDIVRDNSQKLGDIVAGWALERYGDGVIALGLGGKESSNPPQKFQAAFDKARAAGIPCILHAGETAGAESVWNALETADSQRIGHGVRAVEDPALMAHLRRAQIPLEVCPSSNVCLGVYHSLAAHSLPQLLQEGLYITINSDDPPMFNTTLTNEYLVCQAAYGWSREQIERLVMNGVHASLLPAAEREKMGLSFLEEFQRLR